MNSLPYKAAVVFASDATILRPNNACMAVSVVMVA
jgi:hypothetical protein